MKRFKKYRPWIILGIYWPVVFFTTHTPRPPQLQIYGHDVTLHMAAYMILTWLFWWACYGKEKPHWGRRGVYKVLLVMAAYGALDEATQLLVNRHGDVIDWLSDMGGCLAALATLYLFRHIRTWLIFYWMGMLTVTHWPGEEPFVELPYFWQQFEMGYVLLSYLILTLLWWRSLSPEPRFIFNQHFLLVTLYVLPAYALLDETLNVAMERGFGWGDFFCGLSGIAVGILCAAAFAKHHGMKENSQIDSESSNK